MNFSTKVLLIDDQPIVYEAIKEMLPNTEILYCSDPQNALQSAKEFKPTVILQDLVMPNVDGLSLVKQFRQDESTRTIPLIVLSSKEEPPIKAKAFELGANDYLVKLPSPIELSARVDYHSKSFKSALERDAAYQKLQSELDEAARYVKKLLPDPITTGPIRIKWHFHPSAQLGGDALGYEWLDKNHLSLFLLDVCGHGIGAALLSISVMNALRGQKLSNCNFFDPGSVLNALNKAFLMESQNEMFFTLWYGVIDIETAKLSYASGGHPPGVLLNNQGLTLLETPHTAIGIERGVQYFTKEATLTPTSRLFLFSDGTFEVTKKDGSRLSFEEFANIIQKSQNLEAILTHIRDLHEPFEDDCSLIELTYR